MPPNPLVLAMNRPEYFGTIDAMLSGIAWNALATIDDPALGGVSECQKLVYELGPAALAEQLLSRKGGKPRAYLVRGGEFQEAFETSLAQSVGGAIAEYLDARAGRAIADALRATRPARSDLYPSSAGLWPGLFLQGLEGSLRRENPPNYLEIVAALYRWGARGGTAELEGPKRILGAVLSPPSDDPTALLAAGVANGVKSWAGSTSEPLANLANIDTWQRVLAEWASDLGNPSSEPVPLPFRGIGRTPFCWFNTAIRRLTSDDWRRALPAARWNDWLACVLRTAIGFGFLFEMRYYRRLAQELVGSATPEAAWDNLQRGIAQPTMPWFSAEESWSERDVASRIRQWCSTGDAVRKWLGRSGHLDGLDIDMKTSGPEVVGALRSALDSGNKKDGWRDELRASLAAKPVSNNVEETVRYSLINRERHTLGADLYSVLSSRGRYVAMEPAEEWLVVVAALCSARPGTPTTLAALRESLGTLGIDASRQVIVDELERAGLARSAHDADDALEITPVF